LGLWVELGGRLILVTHWYLFCKVTHHYSGTEGCSLPHSRSICWPNWVNKFFCVFSSSLSLFSTFVCDYNWYPLVLVASLFLAPHIKLLLVWFSSNSQQLWVKKMKDLDLIDGMTKY